MLVDIHTHSSVKTDIQAIQNLTFTEAENLFSSDVKGLYSVGFHPWHADEFSSELMDKLTLWTTDRRFITLGECGLDKNSKVQFDVQLNVFEQQIILSEKSYKPLIIHCVGGFNELFGLRKKHHPHQSWIIHGFRGKPDLANRILKVGCSISFGEHFNAESVRLTPTDRLFIETDESQLPITEIYRSIGLIRNCNPEELNAGDNFLKQVK
jgi:TatD DNase family protein